MMGVLYWVVIILIIGTTVYFTNQTSKKIDRKVNTIDELKSQIQALETAESYISREDVYALADLANRRIEWARKLIGLSEALPRDIAITELDFNGSILTIKGISKVKTRQKDLDRVMDIIDRIKTNAESKLDFTNMKFKFSNRIKHKEQEILSFEIVSPIHI
jgi:Tfp pilus assembly protein PilN